MRLPQQAQAQTYTRVMDIHRIASILRRARLLNMLPA
jgi:hypothetical protein